MEVYKEIINGSKLATVIDLPKALINSKLELIISPVRRKKENISLKDIPKRNMGKVLTDLDRDSIYTDER